MSTPEEKVEKINIEEFAKGGGLDGAPSANRYIIRINKTDYEIKVPEMTGRQILNEARNELSGGRPDQFDPGQFKLTLRLHGGGARTIGLDETVSFREPGVERFTAMKRDQTEG